MCYETEEEKTFTKQKMKEKKRLTVYSVTNRKGIRK